MLTLVFLCFWLFFKGNVHLNLSQYVVIVIIVFLFGLNERTYVASENKIPNLMVGIRVFLPLDLPPCSPQDTYFNDEFPRL